MSKPRGYVIYRGPSLLDGAPIVAVALVKSRNAKTSNMVQTYIIRADVDPRDANRTGADYSICGSCPHRGVANPDKDSGLADARSCYVVMGQGPLQVYKSLQAGKYGEAKTHRAIAPLGAGRMVRLGTYGDPAAVPQYVWESLISEAKGHTAYSHQGDNPGADFNPQLMMRSADSESEARAAWGRGERTFRVLRVGEKPVKGAEIDCPSSRGVACLDCGLCGGASVKAKSITIPGHGAGAVHIH
jgi:hypothetical protein